MAKRPTYSGLFKIANKLSLGKCKCGEDIVVDVELAGQEEESAEESDMARTAAFGDGDWDAEADFPYDEDGEENEKEEHSPEKGVFTESEEDMLRYDVHPEERHVTASSNQSLTAFVKKASSIVDQLDSVADQVESTNPRLAARIDAVSNEIEKRVARLLQRRQNTK